MFFFLACSLLCGLSYHSLTHTSTKDKRATDTIVQILYTAIKQYRLEIACPVQTVEIMNRVESAFVPISRSIRNPNDEFSTTSVMSNLLNE